MSKQNSKNQQAKSEVQKIFNQYDTNKNGVLDKTEIIEAIKDLNGHLVLLGYTLDEDEIQSIIKRADKNNDGQIQIEEFIHLINYDVMFQ